MPVELIIESEGERLSALWLAPTRARASLVLAHGAGAGMRHAFMTALAEALADHGVATLRYQFPYAERATRRIDPPAVLHAAVRAAVAEARRRAPRLPLLAGGKSMGGRMTSQAQAVAPLVGVRGLAFVGFPLHPAGAPATTRAEHLAAVSLPMLFLQGDRDRLADLALLRGVLAPLADRARLHVVAGADHGFAVPARLGRPPAAVLAELALQIAGFAESAGRARPGRPGKSD